MTANYQSDVLMFSYEYSFAKS